MPYEARLHRLTQLRDMLTRCEAILKTEAEPWRDVGPSDMELAWSEVHDAVKIVKDALSQEQFRVSTSREG